ncbi:MAG TPA: rhomboid family intramembrane serine protease, partial [Polyangiaceae bacterium]|nr:rhomboid family intramembrane serine protease [Polyangiaceae bacterium]
VGHFRYALFYLASGVAAAATQILIDPTSPVPMVGASGAIAGVLGAYLVLYPRAPVTVLNPIFPLWFVFGLFLVFPAWLVVGEWFVWNLLVGFGSIASAQGQGGVAFFAHIGGFIAGLLLIRPTMRGRSKADGRTWEGWRPPPRLPRYSHPEDDRFRNPGPRPGRWDPWR